MQTAVTQAFRRVRRTEAVIDIHLGGHDAVRADLAFGTLANDYDAFAALPAAAARDVALKAKEAICSLRDSGQGNVAAIARAFFGQRRPHDAAWLKDLRTLIDGVQLLAPTNAYALACMRSILSGLAKPRLV